jgi:hypothetical protein
MTVPASYREPPAPVFLFDLDRTLIDSVYQHVIAWRGALSRLDIDLSVWRIHRRIGMSGGLFVSALLRETGLTLSEADIAMLQQAHQEEYLAQAGSVRPLPGATQLLAALTKRGVQWADGVGRYRATAGHALGMLGLPEDAPMIPAPGCVGRRGGLSLWALISGFERRCRGHAAYGWAACSGSSSGRLGSTSSPVEAPRSRLLTQGAAWTRAQRASIRRAATQPR